MKTPKTLFLVECRNCNGCYYGGNVKLVIYPGSETEEPDEIAITVRKVSRCKTCKEDNERTRSSKRPKFNY